MTMGAAVGEPLVHGCSKSGGKLVLVRSLEGDCRFAAEQLATIYPRNSIEGIAGRIAFVAQQVVLRLVHGNCRGGDAGKKKREPEWIRLA